MAVEIKFTGAGESVTQATVLKWLKPDGAAVRAGDPVCELETDKATKEKSPPAAGVLSIRVQPGAKVEPNPVLGTIAPDAPPRAAAEKPADAGPARAAVPPASPPPAA